MIFPCLDSYFPTWNDIKWFQKLKVCDLKIPEFSQTYGYNIAEMLSHSTYLTVGLDTCFNIILFECFHPDT